MFSRIFGDPPPADFPGIEADLPGIEADFPGRPGSSTALGCASMIQGLERFLSADSRLRRCFAAHQCSTWKAEA